MSKLRLCFECPSIARNGCREQILINILTVVAGKNNVPVILSSRLRIAVIYCVPNFMINVRYLSVSGTVILPDDQVPDHKVLFLAARYWHIPFKILNNLIAPPTLCSVRQPAAAFPLLLWHNR